MADNNGGLEFVKGMLIGGAIGAIVALLYAPKSGRETREELGEKMEDLYDKAKREYDDSLEKARKSYDIAATRLKDLEIDAKNKAEEVQGLVDDLVVKGKSSVESSTGKLKEALNAAKNAFKEEKKDGSAEAEA